MSSYNWLDDIILPRKRKISIDDSVKRAEFSNFSTDNVILSEEQTKDTEYMVECDTPLQLQVETPLQLQVETADGPRVIPLPGQHIITTTDGQQYLTSGIVSDENASFLPPDGNQTFVLSGEQGGQHIYQDSNGQQYIICDVPNQAAATEPQPAPTYTEQYPATDKQLIKVPSGSDGDYITYEVDCQLENDLVQPGTERPVKAVLDQDKLASLINVLQTGEHGQALSNADLFILVPPEQEGQEFPADVPYEASDIITGLDTNKAVNEFNTQPDITKYVAVKMKKSDLMYNKNKDKTSEPADSTSIKNTSRTGPSTNRKITEFGDGFIKSKPVEEERSDWQYSVFSGAASKPEKPAPKRKRTAPKKEKAEPRQTKLDQLGLDAGQRDMGPTHCPQCGMIYNATVAEDEQDHAKYHKRFLKACSFSGWKTERVVEEYHDGRIILVTPNDPKSHLKKMEEIKDIVDIDLGITERTTGSGAPPVDLQAFLYISNANKIIAASFVEHITKGYPVITTGSPDKKSGFKCSEDPMKAVCGVSRIWVFKQCRRKKIASRLMDCVRANFVFGCTIAKVKMAFSDPTDDGRHFAASYCGTPNFLVYR